MKINKQRIFFVVIVLILIYLVLRQMNIFGESLLFSSNENSYILPGTLSRDFSIIDIIQFYNYRIDQIFFDYPWVVKVSIFIVVSSVMTMIVVLFYILRQFMLLRRSERGAQEFEERYADALTQIYQTPRHLAPREIRKILGVSREYKVTTSIEGRKWFQLYQKVLYPLLDSEVTSNYDNIRVAMDEFGLSALAEQVLLKGTPVSQAEALQIARLTRLAVSEGSLSRLINNKNKNLRRSARWLYILVNMNNPYHFLATDSDLTTWDKMELHSLLTLQLRENRVLPSFTALVRHSEQCDYTSFLVREWGLLQQNESGSEFLELLHSNNEQLRLAVVDAVALRRDESAVPALKEVYGVSGRITRRKILMALCEIHTGSDENFLGNAFQTADSFYIKLAALTSLFHYSERGRQMFEEFYVNAEEDEKVLFKHVLSESKFPLRKFEISL